MYHLRNVIHRTSVPSDTTTNMNSAEDFIMLLLHVSTTAPLDTFKFKDH